MEYWTTYAGHKPNPHTWYDDKGKPHIDDMNIYTFDIETSSYFVTKDGQIHKPLLYDFFADDIERVGAFMYIWMLGINETVYYGRTPEELTEFLRLINISCNINKYFFVHNLAFEFQFLRSFIDFSSVFARKRRKPMRAKTPVYNITWRCSYHLANSSLADLADNYDLPVEKQTGFDYYRIRNHKTVMTPEELKYCEYDCLVLYHYILKELETYKTIRNIPLTATGKVRKEYKETLTGNDKYYKNVRKQYDVDPEAYNALMFAYCGGYTHANTYLRGDVHSNVVSYDFTSSYPYVLLTEKYPCSKFTPANIRRAEDMRTNCRAYLLYVRITNIETKLQNPIIPVYKIKHARGVSNDNGRLETADFIEIWLTEIDFKCIIENYYFDSYEILKSYSAQKDYLPREYLTYILHLYKTKTVYKNVPEAADKYRIAKANLNSLYGMTVTCLVVPKVKYKNGVWLPPVPVDVRKTLIDLQKEAFLNPSWGVYCTAYARANIISIMSQLDAQWIYTDTDSGKILTEYKNDNDEIVKTDFTPIEKYNEQVIEKIKSVCAARDLCETDFSPIDIKGEPHTIGLFSYEHTYQLFKTMGSKKYAGVKNCQLEITIAGVAKHAGAEWLGKIDNFDINYFPGIITGKMTSLYCDDQPDIDIIDYQGNFEHIHALTGLALVPCDYHLKYSDTDVFKNVLQAEKPDTPTEGRLFYE